MRSRLARAGPAAFAAALFVLGCAGAGHEMARGAVPGVVEGISDRAVQEKLIASVDPEVVARATERIAAGVVDGTLDTLADPERLGRVQTFVGAGMEPVGRSVATAITGAFDATVDRVFGRESQLELRRLVHQVVVDSMAEIVRSVRQELGTKEEREAAIGALARTVAREATFGFQDAIDASRAGAAEGPTATGGGNVLTAMGDAAALGRNVLWVGGALVVVLLLGLVTAIVLLLRRGRAPAVEVAGPEASLVLLAQALRSAGDKPWARALRETLAAALRDAERDAPRHVSQDMTGTGASGGVNGSRS
ncbi:MAG: hypothetical protein HY908_20245 [Myxococcales bacterium]|nr:hypothetical protein [Myxococcales bacterium]